MTTQTWPLSSWTIFILLLLRELQKFWSLVNLFHYETIFVDLIIKKSQCEWGYSGGGKVGKVFLVVFSSALVRVEAPRLSAEVSSGFGIAWIPMDQIWDLVLK